MFSRLGLVIVIAIISFLAIIFIWQELDGGKKESSSESELFFYHERKFVSNLEYISEFEFFSRGTRFFVEGESIFLWNFSDKEINKYNKSGVLLATYGQFGNGPADLERVVDILIDSDTLILLDAGNNALKKFLIESGDFVSSFKLTETINKGIFLGNGDYIIQTRGDRGILEFSKYSSVSGDLDNNLGVNSFFSNKDDSGLIYDGFFSKNDCGSIFYVSYQMPNIYSFQFDGSMSFNSNTVYSVPPPKIFKSGNVTIPQDSYIHLLGLFTDCSNIYLLSNVVDANEELVIDVYSSQNGLYLHSIKVPTLKDGQTAVEIFVENEIFYILYDQSIVTYSLKMN
jgi:hypothetical protein